MLEIWKDIGGYEGLYQVSNLGNIKSLKRNLSNGSGRYFRAEIILSQTENNKGYKMVTMYKNGKYKEFTVHRLVAKSFIPNVMCCDQVNHIDGNKENNCSFNLEWCTNGYNQKHRIYVLGQNVVTRKPVLQLSKNGDIIRRYNSEMEASKITGIIRNSISRTCMGKTKTAGGYYWKFAV